VIIAQRAKWNIADAEKTTIAVTEKGAKMELNREQIISDLKYCAESSTCTSCNYNDIECRVRLLTNTLELIKELTEENERLNASCTELTQCCTKLETLYKIECKRVDTVKANTVQMVMTLIKERSVRNAYSCTISGEFRETYSIKGIALDQIAKEIVEGGDSK
jgi:hypothetical protein